MRYTLQEIADIAGGCLTGADQVVDNVFTDSRNSTVGAGALFIAICGRNHDGHAYINELYQRGVRAFVVERDVETEKYADAGFVRVDSSVAALQKIAEDYRSKFKGTVVAITGSNGKTVAKEWIATLLYGSVKLFRSPKSYNSQIGVPLSVLMIEGDEDVALIEAGISQPGEMEKLQRIIRPDIGIITTLGDAHQENFDSLDQKAAEKLNLFRGAGTIIYNSSYPEIEAALREEFPSARLVDAHRETKAYAAFGDGASRENAAAAMALCEVLGHGGVTAERLAELEPVAMRLEIKNGINDSLIINDSYNSDINSLSIALDYLKSVAGSRHQTLILSDILQSGFTERELYEKVAQLVHRSQVDRFVGIGSRISSYKKLFKIGVHTTCYRTAEDFLDRVRREDIFGRAILIKGNRDSQFERLSHELEEKSHTTILEVDLGAIKYNLDTHRAGLARGTKIMAMIKASGYGNGAFEIAGMLQSEGVDYLAVAFADEGVALRARGVTMPLVVLNADSDSFDLMIANNLEPEIYSFASLDDFAAALKKYGERNYPVHIKLDTGMHRLGFEQKDTEKLIAALKRHSDTIRVGSVFSHLASSDDPLQDAFTIYQINSFDTASSAIISELPYNPLRHIANSAAMERFPQSQFDMVRLGIGLYGIGTPGFDLRQVSVLRSRIVQIKELGPGETVGYGREGKITRTTKVATIPMGYADGLNRHLGNGNWSVMIGGKAAPTIGRISMDTCMVDTTGIDCREGDPVIIFGGGPGNGVEDMARALGTIPYEIMTCISVRVKRIYTKE